jgi:hypothetical protein
VQKNAAGRTASVESVPEDRKALIRRMDSNLMGATGYRLGDEQVMPGSVRHCRICLSVGRLSEPGFGNLRAGVDWSAEIFLSRADKCASNRDGPWWGLPIR